MKKLMIVLLAALLLTSCAHESAKPDVPVDPGVKEPDSGQKEELKAKADLQEAAVLEAGCLQGYVFARFLTEKVNSYEVIYADHEGLNYLVAETLDAWQALDVLLTQLEEYLSLIDLTKVQTGMRMESSPSFAFKPFTSVSADDYKLSAEELREWAEKINQAYEKNTDKDKTVHERFRQLAQQLHTDTRSAVKAFTEANEILAQEYSEEGDFYRGWEIAALATKTACKVGMFVGGFVASGGTISAAGIELGECATVGELIFSGANLIVGGIDCLVDVCATGSNIFLGDGSSVTAAYQDLADTIAPVSTLFAVTSIAGSLKNADKIMTGLKETAADGISLIGENAQSLYQEGKIGGITITKPLNSYLADPRECLTVNYAIDQAAMAQDEKTTADLVTLIQETEGPQPAAVGSVSVDEWLMKLDESIEELQNLSASMLTKLKQFTEKGEVKEVTGAPLAMAAILGEYEVTWIFPPEEDEEENQDIQCSLKVEKKKNGKVLISSDPLEPLKFKYAANKYKIIKYDETTGQVKKWMHLYVFLISDEDYGQLVVMDFNFKRQADGNIAIEGAGYLCGLDDPVDEDSTYLSQADKIYEGKIIPDEQERVSLRGVKVG